MSVFRERRSPLLDSFFTRWKRWIWHKRLKLWWDRLWIRKDEFDKSLDIDSEALVGMNEKEKRRYLDDLAKRRQIAHERDL